MRGTRALQGDEVANLNGWRKMRYAEVIAREIDHDKYRRLVRKLASSR